MAYLFNVHYEVEPNLWINFQTAEGGPEFNADDCTFQERYTTWIDAALKKYNAYNVEGGTYIYFETEEDATAFKLRFS